MPKKNEKIFFVSDIFASEDVAINCVIKEEKTCFQRSVG